MNLRAALAPLASAAAFIVWMSASVSAETFNRDVGKLEIVKEAVVAAPADRVWQAWTDPIIIAEFFAPKARIDLAPGGRYELLFLLDAPEGEQGCEGCTVLAYVPGQMLAFSWDAPPKFKTVRGQHTWVVVDFDPLPDGRTRVRLTHLGFGRGGEWNDVYAYFDRAWGSVLKSLVAHFAPAAGGTGGG